MDAPVFGSINDLIARANEVVLGKERQIRLAVTCLLAQRHLLIEDLPGVGKTTLAHALARLLGLDFHRIQFTSDLLPADIIGAPIYESASSSFRFHPGPIFAHLVLADEVNRGTPKTQSALLEAMEERQVTVDGETRSLPDPFFVIATQNPGTQVGTFPLPESQLDRFLMRIELGYPDARAEHDLLRGEDRRGLLNRLRPCMSLDTLHTLQRGVREVHCADAVINYVHALLDYTRSSGAFVVGLSPRAGLALLHAAQAWALMDGRDAVLPEDVQAVFPNIATHRLQPVTAYGPVQGEAHVRAVLDEVPIP